MTFSVSDAVSELERRGLIERRRADHSQRIIDYVEALLGRRAPEDLRAFYRERIERLNGYWTETPVWNDYVGWRTSDELVTKLLDVDAVPLVTDGCGSLFGLDLSSGGDAPAVYFFDHEHNFERPAWAAGSSLARFLLLFAEHDADTSGWPEKWELKIDPDIEHCPRAPAIWDAG